ncbi:hypothetical protein TSMEX_000531 [Taenia solium]|eukprot:TsM_000745700 transcript=TsM_000745700 gene=TsM_000745700
MQHRGGGTTLRQRLKSHLDFGRKRRRRAPHFVRQLTKLEFPHFNRKNNALMRYMTPSNSGTFAWRSGRASKGYTTCVSGHGVSGGARGTSTLAHFNIGLTLDTVEASSPVTLTTKGEASENAIMLGSSGGSH